MAPDLVNFSGAIDTWHGTVLHVTVDHMNRLYATGTGHHSVLLVDRDETVFRGQVIALTGHSGTNESHIHLNLHHYESNGTVPPTMDPFAYPNGENAFEKNNYWIEYNNLVCSY